MKKVGPLALALLMVLSLAACGGAEEPAPADASGSADASASAAASASAQGVDTQDSGLVEFVEMTFGDITMTVPNVFSEIQETQGYYVSSAPGAALTVSPGALRDFTAGPTPISSLPHMKAA